MLVLTGSDQCDRALVIGGRAVNFLVQSRCDAEDVGEQESREKRERRDAIYPAALAASIHRGPNSVSSFEISQADCLRRKFAVPSLGICD